MGANPFLGVLFHWLGGLASGSFYVPFKGVKKWSWETYWLVGGIFALSLSGTPFSVSAAIGFIALFGIAVMEGVILLAYFNQLVHAGWQNRTEAVMRACAIRLRPVLMTCVAACVGLLPAALSTSIGAQVQRPLAIVVVSGITLAPVLILIVLPVLIDLFSRRTPPPTLTRGAVREHAAAP